MFDFASVFQNVLVGLQDTLVGAITQWITSLLGAILPGLVGG